MAKPTQEKKQPQKPDIEEDSDSDSSNDEDYHTSIIDKADNLSDGDDDIDNDSDLDQHYNSDGDVNDFSSSRSRMRRGINSTTQDNNRKHSIEDTVNHAEELKKKSRIDALWVELNNPVITTPSSNHDLLMSAAAASISDHSKPSVSSRMVTITTTYDFAGETITVTKDVPENSKEAKDYARKNKPGALSQSTVDHEDSIPETEFPATLSSTSSIPSSTTTTTTTTTTKSTPSQSAPKTTTRPSSKRSDDQDENSDPSIKKHKQVRYVRRKSTLDELATTYGVKKPPKMNTLEKSKLDWNSFVGKEGIEDELKHHNKDGYMEKVAFLQRTDERRDKEYQLLKKKR
ncbi:swr complex subunit [Entomortierella beljakovae]|nr:swr complex subunit [Entomortierella beljakovae]